MTKLQNFKKEAQWLLESVDMEVVRTQEGLKSLARFSKQLFQLHYGMDTVCPDAVKDDNGMVVIPSLVRDRDMPFQEYLAFVLVDMVEQSQEITTTFLHPYYGVLDNYSVDTLHTMGTSITLHEYCPLVTWEADERKFPPRYQSPCLAKQPTDNQGGKEAV